jgi:hypothetical protein
VAISKEGVEWKLSERDMELRFLKNKLCISVSSEILQETDSTLVISKSNNDL